MEKSFKFSGGKKRTISESPNPESKETETKKKYKLIEQKKEQPKNTNLEAIVKSVQTSMEKFKFMQK